MDGIFLKNTLSSLLDLLGIVIGLLSAPFFLFLLAADSEASGETRAMVTVLVLLGLLLALLCGLSIHCRRRAFLRMDETHLSARFDFTRLECPLSELVFCQAAEDSLTLHLASGRRCVIRHLSNSAALCSHIRRKIIQSGRFRCSGSEPELTAALNRTVKQRRRLICGTAGCFLLLFGLIFLNVFLTGSRELSDFTRQDWMLFAPGAVLFFLLLALAMLLAQRAGTVLHSLNRLALERNWCLLMRQPLPEGSVQAVYADPDLRFRLIVFDAPAGLYYTVQRLDDKNQLTTVHTSGVLPDLRSVQPDVSELIKIL